MIAVAQLLFKAQPCLWLGMQNKSVMQHLKLRLKDANSCFDNPSIKFRCRSRALEQGAGSTPFPMSHMKSIAVLAANTTRVGFWSAIDPATGKILWQTANATGTYSLGPVTSANGVAGTGLT
jgi:hypothetical protein